MRTRSSRFFVILLHLVGVSRHLPSYQGIVGVQPWPIVLEEELTVVSSSSSSSRRTLGTQHVPQQQQQHPSPTEPLWIQESTDGNCMGPNLRFVECGDATLWSLQPVRPPPSRVRMGLFGIIVPEEPSQSHDDDSVSRRSPLQRYTIQVVDYDERTTTMTPSTSSSESLSLRRQLRRQASSTECLVHHYHQEKRLGVEHCRKVRRGTEWIVRPDGTLQSSSSSRRRRGRQRFWNRKQTSTTTHTDEDQALCLHRNLNDTDMYLDVCTGNGEDPTTTTTTSNKNGTIVQLKLVRYRAVTVPSSRLHTVQVSSSSSSSSQTKPSSFLKQTVSSDRAEATSSTSSNSIPHTQDIAHSQANGPSSHPDHHHHPQQQQQQLATLASSSAKLGSSLQSSHNNNNKNPLPLRVLHNTNPILLMGANIQTKSSDKISSSSSSSSSLMQPPPKARRIEVHPYIAASKNEIWKDPQTGLEYRTDLCHYLGRDRNEHGRHTLMGVGQYRKGFVIKVYGIAFYVSKRDALAEPTLEPYAGMSADELRQRPDFYSLFRNMNKGKESANVDRTLLLKTNMQLSTETMRSSLQADWQYLTDEAKATLIDSSMKPRPAGPEMLKVIASPDNPSKCSCSQTAPPEYEADPNCCARGTELAFTWLKNGNLEVRLNRQIVESFPRPDIAEGIFYEYLRYDDPISPELRDNIVDGFPFLLAPLAQVKGFSIGHQQSSSGKAPPTNQNPLLRAMDIAIDAISSHSADLAGMAQRSATDAMTNAGNAARSFGQAATNTASSIGNDLRRRREQAIKQASTLPQAIMNVPQQLMAVPQHMASLPQHLASLPQTLMSLPKQLENVPEALMKFVSRDPEALQSVTDWVVTNITPSMDEERVTIRKESLGRAFGYPLSRWFSETYQAPDEIGPMKITPTMNTTRKVFLAFVHVYLLLLFIVSFPGSYTTRTKLIVRKTCRAMSDSESESSSDDFELKKKESGKGEIEYAYSSKQNGAPVCRNRRSAVAEEVGEALNGDARRLKKSLSYFL